MKKRVAKVLTLAVVVAAPFALPRPSSLDAASAVAAPTNFRFSAGVLITEQTRAGLRGCITCGFRRRAADGNSCASLSGSCSWNWRVPDGDVAHLRY